MSRFFLRSSKTLRWAGRYNKKPDKKQINEHRKITKNRDTLLIWAMYWRSWGIGSSSLSSLSSSSSRCWSWREETRRSVSLFPTEGTRERIGRWRRVVKDTPWEKRKWVVWWWKVGREGGGGSVSDHAIILSCVVFCCLFPSILFFWLWWRC